MGSIAFLDHTGPAEGPTRHQAERMPDWLEALVLRRELEATVPFPKPPARSVRALTAIASGPAACVALVALRYFGP